jgi:DNA replication ATP-dependent helicase Dna2
MQAILLETMADIDEAAFMSQLLQGLDDSFWSAVPSPDPSPVKQKNPIPPATPCTPTKPRPSSTLFAANDYDVTAFLEGSENWDLDADPFSPVKPVKTVATKVRFFCFIFLLF